MTEVDIYIELFTRIGFNQVDEMTGHTHNILMYEGYINSILYEVKLWFNYKTEVVSSLICESYYVELESFNKQSFNKKYKDIIRDIKIKELYD